MQKKLVLFVGFVGFVGVGASGQLPTPASEDVAAVLQRQTRTSAAMA